MIASPSCDCHLLAQRSVSTDVPATQRGGWGRWTSRGIMAVAFLNDAYASKYISVVRVTAADEQATLAILNRYRDKAFSFTGALSFAVMERLNVRHVFTLDDDFAQYGWTIIGPSLGI